MLDLFVGYSMYGPAMSRSSRYLILVGKLVFLIEMVVFLALEKNEYVHVTDTLLSKLSN
jgi:hypothetical protein